MNRILILTAIVLTVLMASCNKEEHEQGPLTQIIVGKKTGNFISSTFDPVTINSGYGNHSVNVNFLGKPYMRITDQFSVSHGDMQEHWTISIETLDSCWLKTNESELVVFKSGDVVDIDSEFQAKWFRFPVMDNNSYLAFKIESDKKKYIGWIKMSISYDIIMVYDYCLNEIK